MEYLPLIYFNTSNQTCFMKPLLYSLLLSSLVSLTAVSQNPTLYLSDFLVKEHHHDLPTDLEGKNIFSEIFFYEKEIYQGGFKEKIITLYNEDLLRQLKGHEILINTNFLFQTELPGFYRNKSLKSVAVINPNSGKAVNGTPNLFFVKDLLTDDNGKLLALVVNKLKEEKNEDLYFSIRDFISGSKVGAGTLADLGLIDMDYIRTLESKHKNQSYVLTFHDGRSVSIPKNTDTPNTIANRTKADQSRLNKERAVSDVLLVSSLTGGSASWGYAGILLSIGAQNSFKEQQRKMAEFRTKQRQLLYNFDLISNVYLGPEDFGPDIYWKFKDLKILEDSGSPVLILENQKGQQILALESLSDMYITDAQAADWISKYGKETYLKLFETTHNKGISLEMIRFSMGYPNHLASAAERDGYLEEVYAFGKEWYYFRDGIYVHKEWKNYRPEMEKYDQQQISE